MPGGRRVAVAKGPHHHTGRTQEPSRLPRANFSRSIANDSTGYLSHIRCGIKGFLVKLSPATCFGWDYGFSGLRFVSWDGGLFFSCIQPLTSLRRPPPP